MLLPGLILALLTFPGIIVHEFAHQAMCWLLRIPVFEVCYFQLRPREPAGYVRHGLPRSTWAGLAISAGPLLINTLLGLAIGLAARDSSPDSTSVLRLVLSWLGASIAMHSFPSIDDAIGIWSAVSHRHAAWKKWAAAPLIGFVWLGALASVFWLNVLYGLFVAWVLPGWIRHALAVT